MERPIWDGELVTTNTLFCGDNLQVLRNHIPGELVDLV